MTIEDASLKLWQQLHAKYPGHFTVGHDLKNTLHVMELKRGHAKERFTEFEGFQVVFQYIGPIKPCTA